MPTFSDFRDGPAGRMCRELGLDVSKLDCWQDYTQAVLSLPDRVAFVKGAIALADRSSPTERVVVAALLFAADLSSDAERLDGGQFWKRARNFSGDTATAVAAAIMRLDGAAVARPALRVV